MFKPEPAPKERSAQQGCLNAQHIRNLDVDGYTVVQSLFSADESAHFAERAWDYIQALAPGVNRHQPETLKNSDLPEAPHGIHKHYGIGQAAFLWELRSDRRVLNIFAEWYKCEPEQLLSSFDGMCVMPGGVKVLENQTEAAARELRSSWVHVDRGFKKTDPRFSRCIQGALNLVDSTQAGDGGLFVYPGAHVCQPLILQEIARRAEAEGKKHPPIDFVQYPIDILRELQTDARRFLPLDDVRRDMGLPVVFKPLRISAAAGDMVLWRSDLPHSNVKPANRRERIVAYLCHMPLSAHLLPSPAKAEVLHKRRMMMVEQGRTSNHWGVEMNGAKPQTYGKIRAVPLTPDNVQPLLLTYAQLSPAQKRLVWN